MPDKNLSFPPEFRVPFRRCLLRWFQRHARDLPWRQTRDVYAIWVSEIMLQQTQVATVIPYYQRFLAAFPTVEDLAEAPLQQVLRLWEGLGYYRRARQLHEAAHQVVAEHGGTFPADVRRAQQLPGIGRYTAGAILSIVRDVPLPILEANTVRVFARLLAYPHDPAAGAAKNLFWQLSESLVPRTKPGIFNQALMELGSMVCLPLAPRCAQCPVAPFCEAHRRGLQHQIPAATRKISIEQRREVAVIVRDDHRVLIRQCAPGERWAGLWDFPRFEVPWKNAPHLMQLVQQRTFELTGVHVQAHRPLTTLRHGVTRYRITLDCYEADVITATTRDEGQQTQRWLQPHEVAEYPLSVTGRKILDLLLASAAPLAMTAGVADNQRRTRRPARHRKPTLHEGNSSS